MSNEHVTHEEHHAQLQDWCNRAGVILVKMNSRLEALERSVADLSARLREWEVGPR